MPLSSAQQLTASTHYVPPPLNAYNPLMSQVTFNPIASQVTYFALDQGCVGPIPPDLK